MPPRTIRLSADNRPLLSVPLTTAFDTVTDFTGNGEPARWHRLRSAAGRRPSRSSYDSSGR